MIKGLEVTLYDVFGYLVPGFVFLAALAILFWAIFAPDAALSLPEMVSDYWLGVVIVSYIAGHFVQGLGNLFTRFIPSNEQLVLSVGGLPDAVVTSIKRKARSMFEIPVKDLDLKLLYQLCDEAIVQRGETSQRDIHVYREGFYRGLAFSLVALFLSLVVRSLFPGTSLDLSGTERMVSRPMLLFVALVSLIGGWLSFGRYRRFGRYRIERALLGFLALPTERPKE